jgi:F0F1-type ATP synthase membrane subunit b/b'
MATTFSTAKVALDEIAARIQQNRQRLQQAQALSAAAEADLAGMGPQYGTIVADIDAAAAAGPGNAALQSLKAEKDMLVAEFNTLKTGATGMKNATAGVSF